MAQHSTLRAHMHLCNRSHSVQQQPDNHREWQVRCLRTHALMDCRRQGALAVAALVLLLSWGVGTHGSKPQDGVHIMEACQPAQVKLVAPPNPLSRAASRPVDAAVCASHFTNCSADRVLRQRAPSTLAHCPPAGPARCLPQGGASFGVLAGDGSPLTLRPLDLLGKEASFALPLANPMLTVAQLPGVAAVARPVLVPKRGDAHDLLLFFAAQACDDGRWGIAAARSHNGGTAWRPLGWVLREEGEDLRGAAVFKHEGSVS